MLSLYKDTINDGSEYVSFLPTLSLITKSLPVTVSVYYSTDELHGRGDDAYLAPSGTHQSLEKRIKELLLSLVFQLRHGVAVSPVWIGSMERITGKLRPQGHDVRNCEVAYSVMFS